MLENIVPLEPVHFFSFQIDGQRFSGSKLEKKHLLPDFSSFQRQIPFADVSFGWKEEGIAFLISVQGPFDHPAFPRFEDGDCIELFIDTRDVKTSGYPSRFCHHFFFLPISIEVNGELVQAGEVTRFRGEESRPLCNASQLMVESFHEKKKRNIHIFIPSECLHGYDPLQFDRLGFTYRLSRSDGSKQYFTAHELDFSVESQPSFWASIKLNK